MLNMIRIGLDRTLEFVTAAVMGILVIDVMWQVITRFVLKNPSNWTEELATYLLIWVGMLGAAVALKRKAHLGIDYFTLRWSGKKRLYAELFVAICVIGFAVSILLIGGYNLVSLTFKLGQTAPATGIPLGYVYLAVPISGFFITIYGFENLMETLAKFRNEGGE